MTESLEDLDVRAPESVDRLLHIAHGEQTLSAVLQPLDDAHLHIIRVLRFVEQDVREALSVRRPYSVVVEQLQRAALHVLEVEVAVLTLELLVLAASLHRRFVDLRLEWSEHLPLLTLELREIDFDAVLEKLLQRIQHGLQQLTIYRAGRKCRALAKPLSEAGVNRLGMGQLPDDATHRVVLLSSRRSVHFRAYDHRFGVEEPCSCALPLTAPVLRDTAHRTRDVFLDGEALFGHAQPSELRGEKRGFLDDLDQRRPFEAESLAQQLHVPGEPVVRVELFQSLIEENAPRQLVHDAERRVEASRERILAQDSRAEAVDRRDVRRLCLTTIRHVLPLLEAADDALLHLRRRLLGKRDREDLERRHAVVVDEVDEPFDEDRRLARPGAGGERDEWCAGADGSVLFSGERVAVTGTSIQRRREGLRHRDGCSHDAGAQRSYRQTGVSSTETALVVARRRRHVQPDETVHQRA